MKKYLLIQLLCIITFLYVKAEKKDVVIVPDTQKTNSEGNQKPRSPMYIPNVSIENYTLFFDFSCIGCTIRLLQDDVIVYSDIVDENGEVQLPSNLSGTYTLQLQFGSITFEGEIEL